MISLVIITKHRYKNSDYSVANKKCGEELFASENGRKRRRALKMRGGNKSTKYAINPK